MEGKRTFRTYDPLSMKNEDWNKKRTIYVIVICCIILITPILYFVYIVPTIANKIWILVSCALFILLLYLIGKFYNYKYNGGADVSVTKELVEIKLPNNQRKIFSMNSIKKIMLHDNSSKDYDEGVAPLLLTFTIWTSSPLGVVKLRFMNSTGRAFIKEVLKNKPPKKKGNNLFRKVIHDNLEEYYF